MFTWFEFSLMDANSPFLFYLYSFHDLAMLIIIAITTFITYMISLMFMNKFTDRYLLQGNLIEIIWTIIPMFILMIMAIPSLKILYFIDELWNPMYFTIKAIAHQWYWSYEYPEFKNLTFDSYMISNFDKLDLFRLLDVDNRMLIPMMIPIRLLTTSTDVIHSWTIPSMGIKIDATPGRLNQGLLFSLYPGLFFGQCSEICGANHSFMPIVMESTTMNFFYNWILSNK